MCVNDDVSAGRIQAAAAFFLPISFSHSTTSCYFCRALLELLPFSSTLDSLLIAQGNGAAENIMTEGHKIVHLRCLS